MRQNVSFYYRQSKTQRQLFKIQRKTNVYSLKTYAYSETALIRSCAYDMEFRMAEGAMDRWKKGKFCQSVPLDARF